LRGARERVSASYNEGVMKEKQFYVYILAKGRNSTFYVGVTSDLVKRVWQHKNEVADGFTKKHGIKTLVYYEAFDDAENAIKREKRLKKWTRESKMRVIEEMNPEWSDLYDGICG
jgi:putative endonuclease